MSTPESKRRLSFAESKQAAVFEWERTYLVDLLHETRGNVSKAARLARCDRNHLRDLLRKHKLVGAFREPPPPDINVISAADAEVATWPEWQKAIAK